MSIVLERPYPAECHLLPFKMLYQKIQEYKIREGTMTTAAVKRGAGKRADTTQHDPKVASNSQVQEASFH